jgi:hypothetical protein
MNNQTLESERAWLDLVQSSTLVGICLLDGEGRLVQRLDCDPRLRDALTDYQAERVRELLLSERALSRQPVTYPTIAK